MLFQHAPGQYFLIALLCQLLRGGQDVEKNAGVPLIKIAPVDQAFHGDRLEFLRDRVRPVSYTHLDVYKRQQ